MRTGNFVLKHKGHHIPATVLELLIKENPHGWGVAGVHDGKVIIDKHDLQATLETIQELQDSMENQALVFFFANFSDVKGASKDDVQPFTLLSKGEDEPTVVIFMDGDFSGYSHPESSHTDTFFAGQHLVQHIDGIADMVGGDLDKITTYLGKDPFSKILFNMNIDAEKGTAFCIISAKPGTGGEFITRFSNSETTGSFKWGIVSNCHGYSEGKTDSPVKEETVKTPTGKADPFASMRKGAVAATTAIGAAFNKAKAVVPINNGPVIKPESSSLVAGAADLLVIPDEWSPNKHKDHILEAYRLFAADKTSYSNWKTKPVVRMKAGQSAHYREWLQKKGIELKASKLPDGVHALPDKQPKTEPLQEGVPTPPDVIKDFNKEILSKIKEAQSQVAPDPKKLIAEQKGRKKFSEMIGEPIEKILLYPSWSFAQAVHQAPEMAKEWYEEVRTFALEMAALADTNTNPADMHNQMITDKSAQTVAVKKDPFASMKKKVG